MDEKKELFETMPVPKALAALAVPTIISSLIAMIYNLADTFYIGQTNDPYKVAAVSLSGTLFFMVNALSQMFGIGGGSLISRMMGAGRTDEAKNVCAFSFYSTAFIGVMCSVIFFIFSDKILCLLGVSKNTFKYAYLYMLIVIIIGAVPSMMNTTMANILRSEGFAKNASFGLGMGGICNIVLDPIMMFVILPKGNEKKGVALATLISTVISFVYMFAIFLKLRKRAYISVNIRDAVKGSKYIGQVISVGFPSAVGGLLANLSGIVINKLVSGYGDLQLAAMGLVKKIDMIPTNIGMGLCQGMLPLVAYNYASGDYKRMKAVTSCARIAGMSFAVVCVALFELFPQNVLSLFIDNEETILLGTKFLRICCIATPLMVSNVQMSYTYQGMGKGGYSFLFSACRQGLINIPLLFVMKSVWGIAGICCTQFIADGITMLISLIIYSKVCNSLLKSE